MRKRICLALMGAVIVFSSALVPFYAAAQEEPPSLKVISFKNAEIDSAFDENNHTYSLTLEDNTASPTLESYALSGDADIFINYLYDDTNHQTGVTATLQFEAGSSIYTFNYSNPADYDRNGDNSLSSIYCAYGELAPGLNSGDTAYKLYIPSDLTQFTITPVTNDINAYCAPVTLTLSEKQSPKITLTCIASNGQKKDYVITVKRVDKTVQQVKQEMAQPGYSSFVEGTRLFEKPEFLVTSAAAAGAALIILLLFVITRRIAVNPYDKDEKPFYSSIE